MSCRVILAFTSILAFAQPAFAQGNVKLVEEAELRSAAEQALKLVQRSQVIAYKKQDCSSCHHQLIPEITMKVAHERGIAFDEKVAHEITSRTFASFRDLDRVVHGIEFIDVGQDGLLLMSAHAAGLPRSLSTDAYAQFIASRQLADGRWTTVGARPPQEHSTFSATAACIKAVTEYLPERLWEEKESCVKRAREWLLKTEPRTTEDKVYQLFGLLWTGAPMEVRQKAAQNLSDEQRDDGGWSQLPRLASDAYATGEVLAVLHEAAGLPTANNVYQRGLRFLLKSQKPDGSWHVPTRLHPPAPVSPDYYNSDFPHKKDQFISIMGTTWAVTALAHALPIDAKLKRQRIPLPDFSPPQKDPWVHAALSGSSQELEKLLSTGMSPNTKTTSGTTALMLAARDPDKVKLLLEKGANVNARAKSGFSALMIAARYGGNVKVVNLLLKNGAETNVGKGVDVRYNASASFFAVTARDVAMTKAIIDAGADPSARMKLLGMFQYSPLGYATPAGDSAMVQFLLSRKADVNELDDDGISLLGWAVINNHLDIVNVLLAKGAEVNHKSKAGFTPLMYAASIDYGDTAVLERLIVAGADLTVMDKDGRTALDLARNYGHRDMAKLLAEKGKKARKE